MCVSILNDFLRMPYLESSVNEEGVLSISYSAYSCDSSFYEEVEGIKFCPYCGDSIKSIFAGEKKRIELENKKKEAERLKRLEERKRFEKNRQIAFEIERNNLISNSLEKGSYFIFLFNGKEYKAVDKRHLVELLGLKGKVNVKKNAKAIKRFIKFNEVSLNENKVVKSEKVNQNQYSLNKDAKVGDHINCANCNKEFIKKQYSQVFCENSCKNKYWGKVK